MKRIFSNKSNKKALICIAMAIVLFVTSYILATMLVGYIFSAMIIAGAGCLCLLFAALNILAVKKPVGARNTKRCLWVLIWLGVLAFVIAEVPIVANARTDKEIDAEYLIVLGAGVNGTRPSLSLINRLNAALSFLEEHPKTTAIVSGGQGPGEDITEAEAMRIWLEDKGIAPERIIMEDQATSTLENIAFSLNIIDGLGGDPLGEVAIVSSEYHLYRAKTMAREFGAEPKGVAAKTTLPMLRANYFIREGFGIMYNWVFGYDSSVMSACAWYESLNEGIKAA